MVWTTGFRMMHGRFEKSHELTKCEMVTSCMEVVFFASLGMS